MNLTDEVANGILTCSFMLEMQRTIFDMFENPQVLECAEKFETHALIPMTEDEKKMWDAGPAKFLLVFEKHTIAACLLGFTICYVKQQRKIIKNLIRMEICHWLAAGGERSVESWARCAIGAYMVIHVGVKMLPTELRELAANTALEKFEKTKMEFEQASDPKAFITVKFAPEEVLQTMEDWRSQLILEFLANTLPPEFDFLSYFVPARSDAEPWCSPEAWIRAELSKFDGRARPDNANIVEILQILFKEYRTG